jgi:tRNA (guanine-N7-)-methyltransferase
VLTPGGRIHLKTDSPDLYRFTKLVTDFYQCTVHTSSDDVYGNSPVSEELQIKTHYESLDIAGSKKIHHCCFSLSANLGDKEKDNQFKNLLLETEGCS